MLNFRLRFASAAVVAAGLLAGVTAQSAHAQFTALPNNSSVTPALEVGFASAGTQVGTTQTATFNITNTQGGTSNGNNLTGVILSAAFHSTAVVTSPLDFYYQIQLTGGAGLNNTALQQLTIGEFGTFTTAAGQTNVDIDGGGPFGTGNTATANTSRTFDGSGLNFNFTNFSSSGNSFTQVIRTNATAAVQGSGSVQGTGVSQTAVGTVLVTGSGAAPEPGSIALLGTGLVSMGGMVIGRRRRNAKK